MPIPCHRGRSESQSSRRVGSETQDWCGFQSVDVLHPLLGGLMAQCTITQAPCTPARATWYPARVRLRVRDMVSCARDCVRACVHVCAAWNPACIHVRGTASTDTKQINFRPNLESQQARNCLKPNGDAGLRVITLGSGNPILGFLYVRAHVRCVRASWYSCVHSALWYPVYAVTYCAKGFSRIFPRGLS
jgi:hypothetical protein